MYVRAHPLLSISIQTTAAELVRKQKIFSAVYVVKGASESWTDSQLLCPVRAIEW